MEIAVCILSVSQLLLVIFLFVTFRNGKWAILGRVNFLGEYLEKERTLEELEDEIEKKRKSLENPSTNLAEFLEDISYHGCGVLRISPGNILIRGTKKA